MIEKPVYFDNSACLCFQLSKSARTITSIYDEAFRLGGLEIRAGQFNLMAELYYCEYSTLTKLARMVSKDRTTLSRNMIPLLSMGLIARASSGSLRSKKYELTPKGEEVLQKAFPIWEKVTKEMLDAYGKERYKKMLEDLYILRGEALNVEILKNQ